jgi:hypothetical protein
VTAAQGARTPGAGLAWLGYAAAPLAAWLAWWAAFYPGLVSYDPLYEWEGLQRGVLYDWHPFVHALLVRALARPGDPFGLLTLLHVVATAALVGLALSRARRLGAPRPLAIAASLAFAALPTFGAQVIAAWKDTTFGIAVLASVVLLLDGLAAGKLGVRRALPLALFAAFAALLRHPGIGVTVVLLAGAVALFPTERRLAIATAALSLSIIVIVRGPVRRALDVVPAPPLLVYHSVLHEIAAHVAAGTPLTTADAALLSDVFPLDAWRARYDCRTSGPLLFDPAFGRERLEPHAAELFPLWVRLAASAPATLLRHRACVTEFLWNPSALVFIGPYDLAGGSVDANPFGVANRPLVRGLGPHLAFAKIRVEVSKYRRVLSAPATFLYVLLGAALLGFARTRGRLYLVLAAIALVNTATYLLLGSSPEVRFQWPLLLLAPLSVVLAAADWARVRSASAARPRVRVVAAPPALG